jgi:flagellar biosynthesis/type III secretory pathway M-ring protein FliF/YscJ
VKDLDHVLAKITDLELEALPFSSASVRALIAHSTPRLSEDDVDVEFSRVLPKTVPVKSDAVMRASWDKPEVIMGLAALAAVLACLLIGLAIAWSGLKKQLAQARAAAAKAAQQQFSGSMNAQAPMAPPQ